MQLFAILLASVACTGYGRRKKASIGIFHSGVGPISAVCPVLRKRCQNRQLRATSYCRRVLQACMHQSTRLRQHEGKSTRLLAALKMLARPVHACNQAAAFNPTGLGVASSVSVPALSMPHPVISDNSKQFSRLVQSFSMSDATGAAEDSSIALDISKSGVFQDFPFLRADAFAKEAEYDGFGLNLVGREACGAAFGKWRQQLPALLRGFTVISVKMLPPDASLIVRGRYTVAFDAPAPPQILPAQRARIRDANLTFTAEGLVHVEKSISATAKLDSSGKVLSLTESIVESDVFDVRATLGRFELVYAHHLALGGFSILNGAKSYWAAFRELTRAELDQTMRERQGDESRVFEGEVDGAADEYYELAFAKLIVTGLLQGAVLGVLTDILRRAFIYYFR